MRNRLVVAIALLVPALSGCVGTKAGAYRAFAEDLERLTGQTLSEAYVYNVGMLKDKGPEGVKGLETGNQIYVYQMESPRQQDCTIHVEINKAERVVNATSQGPECWRAY